jgi:hypothetical protein
VHWKYAREYKLEALPENDLCFFSYTFVYTFGRTRARPGRIFCAAPASSQHNKSEWKQKGAAAVVGSMNILWGDQYSHSLSLYWNKAAFGMHKAILFNCAPDGTRRISGPECGMRTLEASFFYTADLLQKNCKREHALYSK